MKIDGNTLLARALRAHGIDDLFFLMGGPTLGAASAMAEAGMRLIDVRHEQAAAMMAHAWARLRARPGACMAASGPGTINLTTGLANALVDCAPVLALGGSSPVAQWGTGGFQEFDQLALMKTCTKWAARVHDAARIPQYVATALRQATSGKPGPVYLDLPGDVLYAQVNADRVHWPQVHDSEAGPAADADAIARLVDLLASARRPVILSGSGVLWSRAASQLQQVVEATGIPFFTTPQGRGAVPDDHPWSFPAARSMALREADVVVVVGTRLNYISGYGLPPRYAADARFVRIDICSEEVHSTPHLALGLCADAGTVLAQWLAAWRARGLAPGHAGWRERLAGEAAARRARQERELANTATPIHPLRLCKEVRDFLPRDAILVVDGQEILNYARQSIPTFLPGHRLNSGPFGTMGVGLPFGVGAKAACPDRPVVVLHGDGSFGLNAMELDTAVRHRLPLLVVVSLNGGWTADPQREKQGRELGYTRFDQLAQSLGCHGEQVDDPEQIAPALRRAAEAVRAGRVALVNVVTDWRARATTVSFTNYTT